MSQDKKTLKIEKEGDSLLNSRPHRDKVTVTLTYSR